MKYSKVVPKITIKVVIRNYKGEVIALFPERSYKTNYKTMGYSIIDGHFYIDYKEVIRDSKQETEEESKVIILELNTIGYDPIILKRGKCKFE